MTPALPLRIEPEAELDIARALGWYEQQREGLGHEFLLSLEAAFHELARRPKSLPIIQQNVRRMLCRRFPYFVLFIEESTEIRIVAVFHHRRDPRHWQARVE